MNRKSIVSEADILCFRINKRVGNPRREQYSIFRRRSKIMRLALAQMSMAGDIDRNFNKSLQFLDLADEHKADLVFFPEVQLTPFFPQYRKKDVGGVLNRIPSEFAIDLDDARIKAMADRAKRYGFYVSPNFYVRSNGHYYDMSLWINPEGQVAAEAKMVHIADAPNFHETDYYTPSESGFFVYDTPFGCVGIVICYDRHLPESIATCVAKGADLVIIPTANAETEPLEMYEWEMRVAAFQNGVFIAMANRVGQEGDLAFAGQSMVIDPEGHVVVKADNSQQFIICNIELSEAAIARKKRAYRAHKRPEMYQ